MKITIIELERGQRSIGENRSQRPVRDKPRSQSSKGTGTGDSEDENKEN